jgi:hypothetical protein
MTAKDMRQIGTWAIVTIVVAMCSFGLRTSFAQRRASVKTVSPPTVMIAGLKITAKAAPVLAAPGTSVAIQLVATNPSTKLIAAPGMLVVEKVRYKGSPLSRVVNPKDFVWTTILTKDVKLNVQPGKSQTIDLKVVAPNLDAPKDPKAKDAAAIPGAPVTERCEVSLKVASQSMQVSGFSVQSKIAGK